MSVRIFGTDGIRGRANEGYITPEWLSKLALAASKQLSVFDREYPHVIIGKDTRHSSYMLENALSAGFLSAGLNVTLVGPVPTPAVSMLVRSMRADLGVMISASHNPFYDNGVKLFSSDGRKLSDESEKAIEALINNSDFKRATAEEVGKAKRIDAAPGRYMEHVKRTISTRINLEGKTIVVDTANGSAYNSASEVFSELGAKVIPIHNAPDGKNINHECGALYPNSMLKAVKEHGADIGIALDGDADRVVLSDEKGNLIDGDKILGIIAHHWKELGKLDGGVVLTVMCNLGLEMFLKQIGVNYYKAQVGDKYVSLMMQEKNCWLGGETSGHIIFRNHCPTGDGIVAALQVIETMMDRNKSLSELAKCYKDLPIITRNVEISDRDSFIEQLEKGPLKEAIDVANKKINGDGMVIVRPSGTENVARITVKSPEADLANSLCNYIIENINSG